MDVRRGEVFYIMKAPTTGSEIEQGRPAVIVSNNHNNLYSNVAEVVFMTTQPKKPMPTHVIVNTTGTPSTVLCEQISTVSEERTGDYCGACSETEMKLIDNAILQSLGIDLEREEPKSDERLIAERDIYRNLYEKLLETITR